jgi:hypothetical protein
VAALKPNYEAYYLLKNIADTRNFLGNIKSAARFSRLS